MRTIKTDVCIIGSGFSGTFVAHKLMGTSARIIVLEKGAHLSWERLESNYLNETNIFDNPVFNKYPHSNIGKSPFQYSGRHAVGGASLVWFGNASRKVPNDFRTRTVYGFGDDWPISYEDLEEYYFEAEQAMMVSGPPFDLFTKYRKKPFPLPPFDLPPGSIELNRHFQGSGFEITASHKARLPIDVNGKNACCGAGCCGSFCPTDSRYNCLTTHIQELFRSDNVKILDKMTVIRLIQKEDRIIEAVAIDHKRRVMRIRAEIFVLAANAVENARIMLLSEYDHLKTGFKIKSDAVGKYLTDQVGREIRYQLPFNLFPGYEKTAQSSHSLSFYDGPFRAERSGILVELWLGHFDMTIMSADHARVIVLKNIKQGLFGDHLKKRISLDHLGKGLFILMMEMIAEKRNCVALHKNRRDKYGDPVAEFNYSVWDQDYLKRSVNHYNKLFEGIVENAGGFIISHIPRISFDHMLGTCRMGDNLNDSVVDANLKSHDHRNLYIVGGSAFPTAGINNPTLTIVALAMRCGDHLKKLFKIN